MTIVFLLCLVLERSRAFETKSTYRYQHLRESNEFKDYDKMDHVRRNQGFRRGLDPFLKNITLRAEECELSRTIAKTRVYWLKFEIWIQFSLNFVQTILRLVSNHITICVV